MNSYIKVWNGFKNELNEIIQCMSPADSRSNREILDWHVIHRFHTPVAGRLSNLIFEIHIIYFKNLYTNSGKLVHLVDGVVREYLRSKGESESLLELPQAFVPDAFDQVVIKSKTWLNFFSGATAVTHFPHMTEAEILAQLKGDGFVMSFTDAVNAVIKKYRSDTLSINVLKNVKPFATDVGVHPAYTIAVTSASSDEMGFIVLAAGENALA